MDDAAQIEPDWDLTAQSAPDFEVETAIRCVAEVGRVRGRQQAAFRQRSRHSAAATAQTALVDGFRITKPVSYLPACG